MHSDLITFSSVEDEAKFPVFPDEPSPIAPPGFKFWLGGWT